MPYLLFRNSGYFNSFNWLLLNSNGESSMNYSRLTQNFLIKEKWNSLLNMAHFNMNNWIQFKIEYKSSDSHFPFNEILLNIYYNTKSV